ncbi:MAG: hypothetical protein WC028_24855 [Candidatus Obscuribacterales bacterium]
MITFEQAKARVISRFQQRAAQALTLRPRANVCDTGKGGAEHSYQVEENRRQAALSDNAASREADKWSSWAQSLEKLQSFDDYIAWLRRNLHCAGWTEFEEGYEVNFAALKAPLYRSKPYVCEILDNIEGIHNIMLNAAPAPQEMLRQAYRRMRVAAKPARRQVYNPNEVSRAVLPALQSYLPAANSFLAALKAVAQDCDSNSACERLGQWATRINSQKQAATSTLASAMERAAQNPAKVPHSYDSLSVQAYQAFAALFNSCVDAYDAARDTSKQ